MIKPGDKVVCIDDEWSLGSRQAKQGISCPLIAGEVYTVVGIERWPGNKIIAPGTPAFVLREVKNPTSPKWGYVGFGVRRFRKLPNISQSMEQLKAIAHNPRQGIKV